MYRRAFGIMIVVSYFATLFLGCSQPLSIFQQKEKEKEKENFFILNKEIDRALLSIEENKLSRDEKRKIYTAFILDAYKGIFLHPLKNKEEYIDWLNILEQGSSVEGVYRGLILSDSYLRMEKLNKKVKSNTKNFFAREVARDTLNMECVKEEVMDLKFVQLRNEIESIQKKVGDFNFFTLKRILSERLLSKISSLREDRKKLAHWYANLVSCWAFLKIDFGLEERNSSDFHFHFLWSMRNSLGRMQWEVLSRLHRIMNHYEHKGDK